MICGGQHCRPAYPPLASQDTVNQRAPLRAETEVCGERGYSQDATHLSAALGNTGVKAGAGGRSSVRKSCSFGRCCRHVLDAESSMAPPSSSGRQACLSAVQVSGVIATLFGSAGFLGRYVTNSMARQGSQVVYPHRCDELNVQHLKVMGDLGQVGGASWEKHVSKLHLMYHRHWALSISGMHLSNLYHPSI